MKDLACGLKTLQSENARLGINTGTIVDEIQVTLNLKASATGTSTLVVDAKPNIAQTVGVLGINYTDKSEVVGDRSNAIKITLKGLPTANLNEPGKEALRKRGLLFDLGPGVLYPLNDPCNPPNISPEDMARATRID